MLDNLRMLLLSLATRKEVGIFYSGLRDLDILYPNSNIAVLERYLGIDVLSEKYPDLSWRRSGDFIYGIKEDLKKDRYHNHKIIYKLRIGVGENNNLVLIFEYYYIIDDFVKEGRYFSGVPFKAHPKLVGDFILEQLNRYMFSCNMPIYKKRSYLLKIVSVELFLIYIIPILGLLILIVK